jgi:hypothetical protein
MSHLERAQLPIDVDEDEAGQRHRGVDHLRVGLVEHGMIHVQHEFLDHWWESGERREV